jgi:hypothetical protein
VRFRAMSVLPNESLSKTWSAVSLSAAYLCIKRRNWVEICRHLTHIIDAMSSRRLVSRGRRSRFWGCASLKHPKQHPQNDSHIFSSTTPIRTS